MTEFEARKIWSERLAIIAEKYHMDMLAILNNADNTYYHSYDEKITYIDSNMVILLEKRNIDDNLAMEEYLRGEYK